MADCNGNSPVEQLHRQGVLADNFLAVHANYISKTDAALLGSNGCSVVHCPRSHDYFGHRKFPRKILSDAGVNICLGTDSLASSTARPKKKLELNLFSEMQSFAKINPEVSAEEILRMVTINGARALKMSEKIGELSSGSFADLIALPFRGDTSEAYDAALHHEGKISASLIDGRWIGNG
jgi:cytosine/adenosine deaminase-related metal-dependent hydrolase